MSNSQVQSLDENAVFLPVNESSPEFLHCERERQAVERLLSAGPEAFYSSIGTERAGCFLSPEEVSQITSWAQDYRFTPLQQIQRDENGDGSTEMEEFCSTYFPSYSDTPAPILDLGWPEKSPWVPKGSVTVHSSPPADGEPPVREIIRRNLQKACRVIAIVTDRLTDGAIIGDLHNAASRGVPVYIILNQRSIQENFTLNRLRHPNMRVRVIGGKTFCSRTGRMVVGEMKPKFLLVDLETVIHGSYSLTWTDAHLHRQLITVLRGPVVDSFDREFRIIFAASLPISDTWRVEGGHTGVTHRPKDFSNLRFPKNLPLEPDITSPPSPPPDSLLDWEAMGVVQRDSCFPETPLEEHEEIMAQEMPLQNNVPFDNNTPIMDAYGNKGNTFVDKKRLSENTSPVTNNLPNMSNLFNNTQPTPTDLTSAEKRRVEHIVDRTISRRLSIEKSTNEGERTAEPTNNIVMLSSSKRGQYSRRESILEEESRTDKTSFKTENTPSSRKPLILRVPQSESFSSLSDIMKRIQLRSSTSGLLKRGSRPAVSEMSQSMMDLSVPDTNTNHEEKGVPMPRLKASCYDPGHMTPAVALMKTRNDAIQRAPKTSLQIDRPSNSRYSLNMDWRRSLAEREREHE